MTDQNKVDLVMFILKEDKVIIPDNRYAGVASEIIDALYPQEVFYHDPNYSSKALVGEIVEKQYPK